MTLQVLFVPHNKLLGLIV